MVQLRKTRLILSHRPMTSAASKAKAGGAQVQRPHGRQSNFLVSLQEEIIPYLRTENERITGEIAQMQSICLTCMKPYNILPSSTKEPD